MYDREEVVWLLYRLEGLETLRQERLARGIDDTARWAIHRNIWQGSYDVWSCKQDEIDAIEIPKRRMKEAEEGGFIKSEKKTWRKWTYDVWSMTEAGKALLEQAKTEWSKGND
jgi:hypothetical protein